MCSNYKTFETESNQRLKKFFFAKEDYAFNSHFMYS